MYFILVCEQVIAYYPRIDFRGDFVQYSLMIAKRECDGTVRVVQCELWGVRRKKQHSERG